MGASRKSPNDAPWGTVSLRLGKSISAPLLTVHLRGTCITPDSAPAGYVHHSGQRYRTAVQGTCGIRAPLRTAAQGTCGVSAPLRTAVQGTCGVPAPLLTAVLSWGYEDRPTSSLALNSFSRVLYLKLGTSFSFSWLLLLPRTMHAREQATSTCICCDGGDNNNPTSTGIALASAMHS